MRLHILGIGGTFMSGIALLAKQLGHEVTGSDMNLYPPMSTQLQAQGISFHEGYDPAHIDPAVDYVIVGNVIKRGNPAMEHVLAQGISYTSGPAWLREHVLAKRHVLAVSGTHGKTTTTSLLTWILEVSGLAPGYLIGGIPENFGISSRLGQSSFFVIEADEYDSAFFDKRSKFIHYQPRTLILNNLEYDHADIFPNLAAIKQQFHYLIRTVPGNGLIICHEPDRELQDLLALGCWTPTTAFGGETAPWQARLLSADGSAFLLLHQGKAITEVHWQLLGQHNVNNALAAIAAAHHVGVDPTLAAQALSTFRNVKRRLEVKGKTNNITVYDDFAHHPTAIATTLAALRANIGKAARMIAVLEFASYTMRSGVHSERIENALQDADMVVCKRTEAEWGLTTILNQCKQPTALCDNVEELVQYLVSALRPGDHVVIMSNGGFGGIHQKLLDALARG